MVNNKKQIVNFLTNTLNDYLENLHAVNIGSAHKSKEDVINYVCAYRWYVDCILYECTAQQFIDWQLDILGDKSYPATTKEFIKTFLPKFQYFIDL